MSSECSCILMFLLFSSTQRCYVLSHGSFCSPGGWWSVKSFGEITGTVAIEMQNNSYIHALDTGLFTLGAPHKGSKMFIHTFTHIDHVYSGWLLYIQNILCIFKLLFKVTLCSHSMCYLFCAY